jgi:hypothetical protein
VKPVRIRYNRLWAPLMALIVVVNLTLFFLAGGGFQLVFAVFFGLFTFLYATRPLLIIDDETITAKSLLGYTVKRIPHGSFAGLEVEGNAIMLGPEGRRQRMTLSRWMVSAADLDKLAAAVREARASG